MAIISPLILMSIWHKAKPKQAMLQGWLYGIGCYAVGVYWIKDCAQEFAGLSTTWALALTIALINIQALFVASQGYVLQRFYYNNSKLKMLIVIPSLWVISEWLRGWMFTGFPWLVLGYSQLDTVLKNFAPLISVYGISWILVFMAGLLYLYARPLAWAGVLGIWILGFVLSFVTWTKLDYKPHTVSLVQPNIKPHDKMLLSAQQHADLYGPLTSRGLDSDLIIWPEHSIPWFLPNGQSVLDSLDKLGKTYNNSIIVGIMQSVDQGFYNAMVAVGTGSGMYYKQRLIPFAEYLPLSKYLLKSFKKYGLKYPILKLGPKQQDSMHLPAGNFLPLICYEVAYAEKVRAKLRNTAASAIINISEDGWFANTWATAQHVDIARMRSLETGRYLLRSSTSGISAIIDHKGNIVNQSEQFTQQTVKAIYYNASGATPWMKLGMGWLIGAMFACILILGYNPSKHLLLKD